jgi:hypothetical protein
VDEIKEREKYYCTINYFSSLIDFFINSFVAWGEICSIFSIQTFIIDLICDTLRMFFCIFMFSLCCWNLSCTSMEQATPLNLPRLTKTNWGSRKSSSIAIFESKFNFSYLLVNFQYRFLLDQVNKHKVCNKKQAQQSEMKTNWKIEIISWKTSFNSVFLCKSSIKCMKKESQFTKRRWVDIKNFFFQDINKNFAHTNRKCKILCVNYIAFSLSAINSWLILNTVHLQVLFYLC